MPGIPATADDAKPDVLDQIQAIEKVQATWGILGAALTLPSVVLGLPGSTSLFAIPVFFLEREKADWRRILNDPPRRDYEIPVRARRRRFYTDQLDDSHLGRAIADWGSETLLLSAYLEAAVRADERAQMASVQNRHDVAAARLSEGHRAVERASRVGVDVAREGERAADALGNQLREPDEKRVQALILERPATIESTRLDLMELIPNSREAAEAVGLVIEDLSPSFAVQRESVERLSEKPAAELRRVTKEAATSTSIATKALRAGYGSKSSGDWIAF